MSQGVWIGRLRRPRQRRRDATPPTLPDWSPEESESEEPPPPPSLSQTLADTLSLPSASGSRCNTGCPTTLASAPLPEQGAGCSKEPRSTDWQALTGYDAGEESPTYSASLCTAVDPAEVQVAPDTEPELSEDSARTERMYHVQCDRCKKWHLCEKELHDMFAGDKPFYCGMVHRTCRRKRRESPDTSESEGARSNRRRRARGGRGRG